MVKKVQIKATNDLDQRDGLTDGKRNIIMLCIKGVDKDMNQGYGLFQRKGSWL